MNEGWETVNIQGMNEWMNEGCETVSFPGWMNEWRMGNC